MMLVDAARNRRPCPRRGDHRDRARDQQLFGLQRRYGRGRWRKLKGIALIRDASGSLRRAELHWYEAHGIGKKEVKRKRYLD
jgi:hypothetical protein